MVMKVATEGLLGNKEARNENKEEEEESRKWKTARLEKSW